MRRFQLFQQRLMENSFAPSFYTAEGKKREKEGRDRAAAGYPKKKKDGKIEEKERKKIKCKFK